jgi:hypothetical protein
MKKNLFKNIVIIAVLGFIFVSCSKKTFNSFNFAFYNVENLFDTIDDPAINDSSFLPSSKVAWNSKRYNHKLENLALVISAIDSGSFPAVFGLSEVENYSVVEDLVNYQKIKKAKYKILHQDSPDERGIDVAMLYNSRKYKPLETKYLKLTFPEDENNSTRDILYSKGLVFGKDTIHIFINHWVSRWGGQEKTEPYRKFTGTFLRNTVDSILHVNPQAKILIAGDLNDNPTDASVAENLNAKLPVLPYVEKTLYNLSAMQFSEGKGTLYYKSWDMFDQIIVSTALLNAENGLKTTSSDQIIFKKEWLLYQPKEGEARPSRTASGNNYFGGFSDHLPVLLQMEFQK